MATVETLKNKNNETFYPVTKTEAVYNADGSENLSVTLTKKADISTDAADANKMMKADGTKSLVNTANIANSAVTSSNIDFTTQTYLPTIASGFSNSPNHQLIIYKWGKICFITGQVVPNSTPLSVSYKIFATIDNVAFRPAENMPCVLVTNDGGYTITGNIRQNGDIVILGQSGSISSITSSFQIGCLYMTL